MKLLVALTLLVAIGCTDEDEDFPIIPAGGNVPVPIGSSTPGTTVITGFVCVTGPVLEFTNCDTGLIVADLTVSSGNNSTVVARNGSFSIPVTMTTTTVMPTITVSGPNVITTTTQFAPVPTVSAIQLPVVTATTLGNVFTANNITITQGTGTILGTVTRSGIPVAGIVPTTVPAAAVPVFGDATTLSGFALGGTGTRGVFLIPGLAAGPTNIAFSPGESLVDGIPVINGGITILDSVALP